MMSRSSRFSRGPATLGGGALNFFIRPDLVLCFRVLLFFVLAPPLETEMGKRGGAAGKSFCVIASAGGEHMHAIFYFYQHY